MNGFLNVLKAIGAVIKWPFSHAKMLEEYYLAAKKDFPQTKAVLVGLVQQFESLTPDAMAVIASKGFDVPEDLKSIADIKSIFGYVKDKVLPTIHQDYTDFKLAENDAPAGSAPAPDPAPTVSTVAADVPAASAVAAAPAASLHPASEQVNGVAA